MSAAAAPVEVVGLDALRRLVAEAARGLRNDWTLDSTFDVYAPEARRRAAQGRAELLQRYGHETRVIEEADLGAVYVWRRA